MSVRVISISFTFPVFVCLSVFYIHMSIFLFHFRMQNWFSECDIGSQMKCELFKWSFYFWIYVCMNSINFWKQSFYYLFLFYAWNGTRHNLKL